MGCVFSFGALATLGEELSSLPELLERRNTSSGSDGSSVFELCAYPKYIFSLDILAPRSLRSRAGSVWLSVVGSIPHAKSRL